VWPPLASGTAYRPLWPLLQQSTVSRNIWKPTFPVFLLSVTFSSDYHFRPSFTSYQSGRGSGLRQPLWSSSAFMDWLWHIYQSTASWRPAIHVCDQPMRACCLFRTNWQSTATGVFLSVDQSRGTVYLWHCVQVTSQRRLSEDIRRRFCLTVLTISCFM